MPEDVLTCSIDGCDRPANVPGSARGWCRAHYRRWQRYGDPHEKPRRVAKWVGVCDVEGCDLRIYGHGLCQKHWANKRRTGDPLGLQRVPQSCSADGCEQTATARGMCRGHYDQARREPARAASAARKAQQEQARQRMCDHCGSSFLAKRAGAVGRFCSRDCKDKSLVRFTEGLCLQCGSQIVDRPSRFSRYEGRSFCSKQCHGEWRRCNPKAIRFGSAISARHRDLYGRQCVICGEARAVEYAHKIPARDGGTIHPENIYVLCPTHHTILDHNPELLTPAELAALKTVAEAWKIQRPVSKGSGA
jgi:hypothetical protein